MTVANTRIPYQSVVQVEAPAPYGLAADTDGNPIPGAPALPNPQPFVRGEKQWMDNADNISNWLDNQEIVSNSRIPYASTLQLGAEGPAANGLAVTEKGEYIHGAPALPNPQPFIRGEKQWMDNAQNIVDYEDEQTTIANTRIPYSSYL